MEGETDEHDYDEFEFLLKEIPNATSENLRYEGSGCLPVMEDKICNSTQSANKGKAVSIYDDFAYLMNQHKRLEAYGDKPELLDDESLSLAFEQLSFKDGMTTVPSSPASSSSPNGPLRLNAFPSMLNSGGVPAQPYPYPLSRNEVNVPTAMLDGCHPLIDIDEYYDLSGMNSLATHVNPGMQSFEFLPRIPARHSELPASAFERQYYMDVETPSYICPQYSSQSSMAWRIMEDERYFGMTSQHICPQNFQNQGTEAHGVQSVTNPGIVSFTGNTMESYFQIPIPCHTRKGNLGTHWTGGALSSGYNQHYLACNGLCRYHPQELCVRNGVCEFSHAHQVLNRAHNEIAPQRILTRSLGVDSLRTCNYDSIASNQLPPYFGNNGKAFANGYAHCPIVQRGGTFTLEGQNSRSTSPCNVDFRDALKLTWMRQNSVVEFVGRVRFMAKDQEGCRLLQKILTEGSSEDVERIINEVIDCIAELMIHQVANYLVQKVLVVCTEDQRMRVLQEINQAPGMLIELACDVHGTRVVQKLIETLKGREQFSMIASSLKPSAITLMKDINGTHVAQRCLQYLSAEYKKFLFDAATAHCVELATDCQGCRVLQDCLDHSKGEQKHRIMSEIVSNSFDFTKDPYGNYVVQKILDEKSQWVTAAILDQYEGHYGFLSTQKFSSHLVEKCLGLAREDRLKRIIHELMEDPQLLRLIMIDQYGNYVIQTALKTCKGGLHAAFVEALKQHTPGLHSHPFGKNILPRLKK